MNLQSLKSLSFLILLGSLCGCAAQSSFKAYYDARDNLAKAKKVDPGHPFLARAELELEAGQRALNEARYSRAQRSFQLVNRDVEKIIQTRYPNAKIEGTEDEIKDLADVDRWASEQTESYQPLPPPKEPVTLGSASVETSNERKEAVKTEAKENRMKLPAEALARYLAQKKTGSSPETTSNQDSKNEASKDLKAAVEKVAQEKSADKSVEDTSSEEAADSDLEAVKPPPAVEPAPKEPASSALKPRTSGALEKLEETLSFVPSETQILPKAQAELDRLSVFLLENPSYSLKLKAGRALGETESLVKTRFEGVRDYLEAKGVARDQVQLDPEALSAKNPVFELYLVEH
ncbi:MAG: hypothetical protein ACO3LE_03290 [Bdellovibrionota bacterium]